MIRKCRICKVLEKTVKRSKYTKIWSSGMCWKFLTESVQILDMEFHKIITDILILYICEDLSWYYFAGCVWYCATLLRVPYLLCVTWVSSLECTTPWPHVAAYIQGLSSHWNNAIWWSRVAMANTNVQRE